MLALALTVGMLTACTGGNGNGGAEALYPGTPDADMITIDIQQEPPQMFSVLTTDSTSGNVLRATMENLVMLDQNNNVIPGMAETWEFDEETLTYTFHLREAYWSNGTQVTANDFVFAWRLLVDPATAAKYAEFGYMFKNGQAINEGNMAPEELGVRAIDDLTLEVELEAFRPYALAQLTFYSYLPVNEEFYLTTLGDDGTIFYGTDADKMIFNGPYVMTSWTHEADMMLEKNEQYYDFDAIAIPKVKIVMLNDSNTRMNAFEAGELDMILLTAEQKQQKEAEGYPVISYSTGAVWYFEFNTRLEGLDNPKIRRALTMGVDAQAFIDNIKMNGSTVATSFTPPTGVAGLENVNFPDEVGTLIDRDFVAAKALLEEGLAEEGLTLETFKPSIICDDTDQAQKYAAFFQNQWEVNLGLEVTVNAMPFKSRIDAMQNANFDIVLAGWAPDYNDPNTFLDLFVTGNGNNHTGYSNPEYDALIAAAAAETDPEARMQILIDAEVLLMEDMPIGPIYFDARDWVCSGKVAGIHRGVFQDINLRWAYLTTDEAA